MGGRVRRTCLLLILLPTPAASFIWGINTLFLLGTGLTNTQAFAANAFYTLGRIAFEVPTGVVADVRGCAASYAVSAVISSAAIPCFAPVRSERAESDPLHPR